MSHSAVLSPVHDTSPPPFDDDVDDADEDDVIPNIENTQLPSNDLPDVLNNSNNNDDDDDWKSVDDNKDTDIPPIQNDPEIVFEENVNSTNDDDWANFATFESEKKTDEVLETSPVVTSAVVEENPDDDWANFESNTAPPLSSSPPPPPPPPPADEEPTEKVNKEEDDDDFGEFSEVQAAPSPPPPPPSTSSLPTETLSVEQIESLISTCFPLESDPSSTNEEYFLSTELPSFTSYKNPTKNISYLESSLSLWNVLSNISNDPVGIKFQWRKSNTERLFHQALGVNERLRTKNVPLAPEILQPEKVKPMGSTNNELENIDAGNKLTPETIRPHFDWKQSGLQNPLADNDSSSLSSNISKNEENGFDANKSLDLDFYVPPIKSSTEEEQAASTSSIQINDSPIIPSPQRTSIPIKTVDLFPGSTTTLNDDAKRIIDSFPNLSFMSAKALMFPIRFNANNNNNDESSTLY